MSKWIIDAGHGGTDSGTYANSIKEKDLTLEAVLYIQKRLSELSIKADVTREKDITLKENERVKQVRNYDKCISCHFNAGGGDGFECIHSVYANGTFEQRLIKIVRSKGFPIRPDPIYTKKQSDGQDWYYMHRRTGKCRVTIIEFDFLDGPNIDQLKKEEYRKKLYECIIQAICEVEGKTYQASKKEFNHDTGNVSYQVVVGSFRHKNHAKEQVKKLKNSGFDSFIEENKN